MTTTVFELFWIFDRPFGSKHELQTCIETMAALPGADWQRYDLDTMQLWKPWRADRALVDAQTQRTAMLRVEGAGGEMAVLALGKRGEPPTLLLRGEFADADAIGHFFRETTESLLEHGIVTLVRGGISPAAARDAYHRALPGMSSVGRFEVPAWKTVLRAADDLLAAGATDLVEREPASDPAYVFYTLLPDPVAPPAEAVDHWKAVAQLLAQAASA